MNLKQPTHDLVGDQAPLDGMVRFYNEATRDYRHWSPSFNMHFGYWEPGMNPFRREPMLENMTQKVLDRLHLPESRPHRILDMGCGMGASMRTAARRFPESRVYGISLVEAQIQQAKSLAKRSGLDQQLKLICSDFTRSPFPNQTFDGIYALESLCHGTSPDKADAIAEAARLLKPGARFAIADGFLKKAIPDKGPLHWVYRRTCDHWRLREFAKIDGFRQELQRHGFKDIKIREISCNIAPVAFHIPLVSMKFLWREWVLPSQQLRPERWSNMLASLLGLPLGMARPYFGYFLVEAKR